MVYDPYRDRVIVFGGRPGPLTHYTDTWEFDGSRWSLLASGGGSSSADHAMAFDRLRARAVVFDRNRQTWEWNGTTWRRRSVATSPPSIWEHAMVYDPAPLDRPAFS